VWAFRWLLGGGPSLDIATLLQTTLTEFKQRQQFLHGDRRFESRVGRQSARKLVKLWAEKESANLMRMARGGVPCPEMVLQHKHVLLLGFIGEVRARSLHCSASTTSRVALR
jgi:serine/threonine-protein kinase RIO1